MRQVNVIRKIMSGVLATMVFGLLVMAGPASTASAQSSSPSDVIYWKYQQMGGISGDLGEPIGGVRRTADGRASFQQFRDGEIYYLFRTGEAHEMHGAIYQVWLSKGGIRYAGGIPISDEQDTKDHRGRISIFEFGYIVSQPQGTYEVHGSIAVEWDMLGREGGQLGNPTTDESVTPDRRGRYNHFEGGSVYWHPDVDNGRAHEVHGAIRDLWAQRGYERSPLGYPVSDARPIQDGYMQDFQYGYIEWTPRAGASMHFTVIDFV